MMSKIKDMILETLIIIMVSIFQIITLFKKLFCSLSPYHEYWENGGIKRIEKEVRKG